MFRADQSIQSAREDKLNRTSFAHSLAEAILDYGEKESLVLGLFGEWGSGKTSILNLALEHIASVSEGKSNEEKPIIVRFNPWNYSEQNQLIAQFFKELSVTLKRTDYASGAKTLGKEIEAYSRFFDPLVLIPTAGPAFMIFSVLGRGIGGAIRGWGEAKAKDLATLKNELNASLDTQKNKIIIVIDDIDRLSDVEIRQMFQLIKSVGDFHNTIYILAFDKNVVAKALDRLQKEQGMKYLEKVVQVPFEVPLMSKQQLEQLLQSQLSELIGKLPQERIDPIYWGDIYYGALRHFFKNIRDVNRYLNSVKFGLSLVKDELNVVDYLAITAIQVFIPTVYYGIRENKELFSGIVESASLGQRLKPEQAKVRCDEIISRSTVFPQEETLKELLTMMFPKLAAIYGNMYYSYDSLIEWRTQGRICHPDIFDTFFRLSIPEGDISRNEIEAILSLANNPDTFAKALLTLNEEGRVIRFLERLEDYTRTQIPIENVGPIISVLMDIGDLFPEGAPGSLSTDTSLKILRLTHQLSHRIDNSERFKIFKGAIEKDTKSLYTIVHEISIQRETHDKHNSKKKPEPGETLTLNADQLEELESLVCTKIEAWVKDGRLARARNLPSILFGWKRMGKSDDVNKFVRKMIRTNDGLINFITSFLSAVTRQGVGSYVASVHWHISLKTIGHFVDVKDIEPRIRKLASTPMFEKLDGRKKLAINSFLDTIDGKNKDPFQDLD